MRTPIRVLIIAADQRVHQELCDALARVGDIQIVGHADSPAEAMEQIALLSPNVIVWDAEPRLWVQAPIITTFCSRYPDSRLLLLCSAEEEHLMLEALRQGAWGYRIKNEALIGDLAATIRTIHHGGAVVGSHLAGWMLDDLSLHRHDKNYRDDTTDPTEGDKQDV